MESHEKRERIEFRDDLTTENLVAAAIAGQIELDRQTNGSLSREHSTRLRRIDPRSQQDYNNL